MQLDIEKLHRLRGRAADLHAALLAVSRQREAVRGELHTQEAIARQSQHTEHRVEYDADGKRRIVKHTPPPRNAALLEQLRDEYARLNDRYNGLQQRWQGAAALAQRLVDFAKQHGYRVTEHTILPPKQEAAY